MGNVLINRGYKHIACIYHNVPSVVSHSEARSDQNLTPKWVAYPLSNHQDGLAD